MPVKNPHVIWASVVIIFILIGSVVVLALRDKDVTVILSLGALVAIPVLSAFGVAIYQKMDQVKELSNGGNKELLKMIKDLQATVTGLALQIQPPDKTEVPWKDDHSS
jgi:hypothetical protein